MTREERLVEAMRLLSGALGGLAASLGRTDAIKTIAEVEALLKGDAPTPLPVVVGPVTYPNTFVWPLAWPQSPAPYTTTTTTAPPIGVGHTVYGHCRTSLAQ